MTNHEIMELFNHQDNATLICRTSDDVCLFRFNPDNDPEYYQVYRLVLAENKMNDSLELLHTFK